MGETDTSRLEGNPDLFVRIAENALAVAEELRSDYFGSTLQLARSMRETLLLGDDTYRISKVPAANLGPCTAVFVDGGLLQIDLGIGVPLIVRAGIFRVKQGERDLEKRETFDHFPLMLGQLKGGLKASRYYGDVVRLIVELGALVTALEDERFSDTHLLMLHGPLQFVAGLYFEHWFYPEDFEQMLGIAAERPHVRPLLQGFIRWCDACPLHGSDRCKRDMRAQHMPAVCVMAFLQDYVFKRAVEKDVLVCGVVERSFGRSITKHTVRSMLERDPGPFEAMLKVLSVDSASVNVRAEAILDATRYNAQSSLAWRSIGASSSIGTT